MNNKTINKKTLTGIIIRLAEMGLNEEEILYSLDIEKSKIASLNLNQEIVEILNTALEARARRVEDALYRRAVGFEFEETVNASEKKPSGSSVKSDKEGLVKSAEKSTAKSTIKTVIPDVTACVFWLKNRLPDKWREPKDSTNNKKSFIELMENLDDEE